MISTVIKSVFLLSVELDKAKETLNLEFVLVQTIDLFYVILLFDFSLIAFFFIKIRNFKKYYFLHHMSLIKFSEICLSKIMFPKKRKFMSLF